MKIKSRKYLSFTMIEILLVTVIIGFIFPAMISVYTFMIRSNKQLLARETAIQQGYEFFEKLNILMQDYTIDYEEYYNRQMVGCVEGGGVNSDFTWNIGVDGYCTKPTGYGNENSTQRQWGSQTISSTSHNIYYCSTAGVSEALHPANGCPVVVKNTTCGNKGTKQSFGQYKAFFIDAGSNKCLKTDDEDLGNLVNANIKAIRDADNIQELYLISHDGKSRLYFRRKKVAESGRYAQYKIQMLRLRGFDAGEKHNFNETNNEGLYDGQIDTWACDTSMGFVGGGNSIGGAYADYYLPDSENIDDCWVDLTYGSTSVYTWKISISPLGDPDLFWSVQDRQINPYMKIFLVNGVYFPNFSDDMSIGSSIESFKVPLQTTINMKNFYE